MLQCLFLTTTATAGWSGRSHISGIGKTVAVRVRMFQAKLFAYRL